MAIPQIRDFRHYPEWLHHELLNWSRWCWLGAYPHPLPPSHCYSIEHQFAGWRLPEGADVAPLPEKLPAPIEARARIVNDAWSALPDLPRMVLRAEYPQRRESGRLEYGQAGAARRLHIRLSEYEGALVMAIGRVWTALEGDL